jgi:tetratricopeptide (TPR) repeat protein
MATKTKTSETSASEPMPALEKLFSEGLAHLDAGRLDQAAAAFTQVEAEAMSQERLNLGRTARGYLTAIQTRLQEKGAPALETAELSAQLLLNKKNPAAALEALDKAIAVFPDRSALHYLKALAYAQLGQGQDSADALAKAVELNGDLLFQFHLEPDFDSIRHTGPFAALLRG